MSKKFYQGISAAKIAEVIVGGPIFIVGAIFLGLIRLFVPAFIRREIIRFCLFIWGHFIGTHLGKGYYKAQRAFLELEEDADSERIKAQTSLKTGLFVWYNTLDWALAWLFGFMTTALNAAGFSFVQVVIAGILFDFFSAIPFVYQEHFTKQDLTQGKDFRRGVDALRSHSFVIWSLVLVACVVRGAIWNGPEYVIMFFRKEIHTPFRVIGALIFLAALQGLFWSWLWTLGYATILEPFGVYILSPAWNLVTQIF